MALGDIVIDDAASATLSEFSIIERFEAMVAIHGSRKAIGSGAWQPSYTELNAAASAFANQLLAHGGAPGDRVAVLMRHDAALFAAVLGVLRAGRVVVALNAGDPPQRLRQIQEDAEPALLVADSTYRQLGESIALPSQTMLSFALQAGAEEPSPAVTVSPEDMAFLLYTSGSTGRPKGVVQTHRNLVHNAFRMGRGMSVHCEDRIVLPASLSGGLGVATAWCALLNGAALCPFPAMEQGVVGFAEWLLENRITGYLSAASILRRLAKTLRAGQRFPEIRWARLAAESATVDDIETCRRHFSEDCVVYHSLSSSETGNIAQYPITRGTQLAGGRLPVGRAAEGVEVCLLDEQGREVGAGTEAELCVKSRYLSPGYWRNETLTAERFGVAGPGGLRLFRSGDLGCFTGDGLLVHLGRRDAQVKIRGYRVELSEIERALVAQPEVEAAAVCTRKNPDEETQLVAGVVLRANRTATAEQLRTALGATLPPYMMPAAFVFLNQLPLTPQGKTDHEALRQISAPSKHGVPPSGGTAVELPGILNASHPANAAEPISPTEALLIGIWKDLFEGRSIGRDSDFFDLGGDSLSAAVIVARMRAKLPVALELRHVFQHARLSDLARAIGELPRNAQARSFPAFPRVSRQEVLPLSFAQQRIWKYSRTAQGAAGYMIACSHRITGRLDRDILRDSLEHLIVRHEMLRTTFDEAQGAPVQRIHPSGVLSWTELQFDPGTDADDQASALLRERAQDPFDLSRLPLVRFALCRVHAEEFRLLQLSHHILSDARSWRILFDELAVVYEARCRGAAIELPANPREYADFAAWQRSVWDPAGTAFQDASGWWQQRLLGNDAPLKLPFTRLWRRRHLSADHGVIGWGVDPEVSARLEEISGEERVTYYVARLAVFSAFLSLDTGSRDLTLGTYVSNRTDLETQRMFGYFSNLAALRLFFDPGATFRSWLAIVQASVLETQQHGDVPYEPMWDELRRRGAKPPEIQAIFNVADHTVPVRFGGVELTWHGRHRAAMPWGFTLTFDQHDEARRCSAAFDAHRYDPSQVQRWLNRFVRFLAVLSREPEHPIEQLFRSV